MKMQMQPLTPAYESVSQDEEEFYQGQQVLLYDEDRHLLGNAVVMKPNPKRSVVRQFGRNIRIPNDRIVGR